MNCGALLLIVFCYLLGSIPSGFLVSLAWSGVDIRLQGSGNPGAANVFRNLGSIPGAITLGLDVLKGFIPICWAQHFFQGNESIILLCGGAAIFGHAFMFFLSFNGGKAVATTAGVFLGLLPIALLPALIVFGIAMSISGHISVGSIAAATVFPPITIWAGATPPTTGLAFFTGILILIKHTSNVENLVYSSDIPLHRLTTLENS